MTKFLWIRHPSAFYRVDILQRSVLIQKFWEFEQNRGIVEGQSHRPLISIKSKQVSQFSNQFDRISLKQSSIYFLSNQHSLSQCINSEISRLGTKSRNYRKTNVSIRQIDRSRLFAIGEVAISLDSSRLRPVGSRSIAWQVKVSWKAGRVNGKRSLAEDRAANSSGSFAIDRIPRSRVQGEPDTGYRTRLPVDDDTRCILTHSNGQSIPSRTRPEIGSMQEHEILSCSFQRIHCPS